MTYTPPPHIRGMIRFWWHASLYLASEARRQLGLTVTNCKPFLRRTEHRDLARLLALLEPVLRRLFYLQAAEQGALPTPQRPARAGAQRPAPQSPDTPPRQAAPRFRLTEARPARTGHAGPVRYRTGPNIRFLDQDYPVDLRDYPFLQEDLLPAAALVRRLVAVNHALDHPGRYIRAMRRKLSGGSPLLAAKAPPAFHHRRLGPSMRESACELQAELPFAGHPDTS